MACIEYRQSLKTKTEQSQQKPERYLRTYVKFHKLRSPHQTQESSTALTGAEQAIETGDLDFYSKRHS